MVKIKLASLKNGPTLVAVHLDFLYQSQMFLYPELLAPDHESLVEGAVLDV